MDTYILSLRGEALYQIGEYLEALKCFECIIDEKPKDYIAMGQRALCLTQLNRHDEALQIYQQALTFNNQDAWIQYNYSLCLLAMGNLLQGFALYEYRWICPLREKRRAWQMPESATIKMLQGKSILIYAEQGLGDSIQFFRYIPLLVALGARVFIKMPPSLILLFHPWRYTIQFITDENNLPASEYLCPMLSLPRIFKTEMHTIPKSIPYLFPNPQHFDICKKKLATSRYLRVGIAWKGSATNTMNRQRSMELTNLLTLHQPERDFICLQKDVDLEEKKQLDQLQIAYHGLELSTVAGTAALIACLDLVITVDTSIAHLAAAMGKKVWILLSFSADWRWFLRREDSPWYPSAKLFRQEILGDWSIPLVRIKTALAQIDYRE